MRLIFYVHVILETCHHWVPSDGFPIVTAKRRKSEVLRGVGICAVVDFLTHCLRAALSVVPYSSGTTGLSQGLLSLGGSKSKGNTALLLANGVISRRRAQLEASNLFLEGKPLAPLYTVMLETLTTVIQHLIC